MRIHANTLTLGDIMDAAHIARVGFDHTEHGSRIREHAFEVKLTGESRRRPMYNSREKSGDWDTYAATWDQWGVFLSVLFDRDDSLTIPRVYADRDTFDMATLCRFEPVIDWEGESLNYWPADAHGDHTFRYAGTPYEQSCTKCSAVQSWAHRLAS